MAKGKKGKKGKKAGHGGPVTIDDPSANQKIALPYTADGYVTADPRYTISGVYAQVDGGAGQALTYDSEGYWTYSLPTLPAGGHSLMVCMMEFMPGNPPNPPVWRSYSTTQNFTV